MNNPATAIAQSPTKGALLNRMASRFGVDENKLLTTLKNTAFKVSNGEATNEQMMALMVVADQHGLNPFTREIYAFEDKHKGVVPVVGVDGWSRIINSHPQFDGMDFEQDDESCTCIMYRKDREHPIRVTEYLSECKRNTGPWGSHPKRMLRHKAMIQCARIAFSFSGIYDPDEAEAIAANDDNVIDITPSSPTLPALSDEPFQDYLDSWLDTIEGGAKPGELLAMLETKYTLTNVQREQILALGSAQSGDNNADS